MKSINDIRDALNRIQGARFDINPAPPVLRWHLSGAHRRTTVNTESPPLISLDPQVDSSERDPLYPPRTAEAEVYRPLDRQVQERGIEALAWYVSFHAVGPEWGIFIPLSSVHYLGNRLFRGLRVPSARRFELSFQVLLQHERFHFATDYAATQFELLLDKPCRASAARRLQPGEYHETEEALANAYMLRELAVRYPAKQLAPIRDFTLRQPKGYRDALPFADDDVRYHDGLEEVVKDFVGLHVVLTNWSLAVPLVEWAAAFNPPGGLDFTECPVHLLHDDERLGPLGPRFLPRLPVIQETKAFIKRLKRLARQFQENWERKKQELQVGPISAKQFEALKGRMAGIYSVRVGSGHRAHLRPVGGFERWEAIDIGTHTEMGHD